MGAWRTGCESRRIASEHPELRRAYTEVLPDWEPSDVGGSPYSISAYELQESLGRPSDLARFRARLHDHGLALVLDFVPNHLARDHPWLDEHPERLLRGTEHDLAADPSGWFAHASKGGSGRVIFAHGRDPYFPGWTDTCQIDYRRPEAREAMTRCLLDLAGSCDGLRCDMAMLVLDDVFQSTWGDDGAGPWSFWKPAIERLKSEHPEFVLMAEAYWGLEDRLIALGFDFAYDKELYDKLLAADLGGLREHLARPVTSHKHRVHFLENHDEARAFHAFGPERLKAAAALTYGLPGMRFFQEGQAEGRILRTPVQLSRAPEEPIRAFSQDFHERLFRILADEAYHFGTWSVLEVRARECEEPSDLLASAWTHRGELRIVVANVNCAARSGRLMLPLASVGSDLVAFEDELTGQTYEGPRFEIAHRGLALEVPAHGALFLRNAGRLVA
jgi:hypothetical protein